MKNIKQILFPLVIAMLAITTAANAQDKKPEEVKKMVESKNYIFIAQRVIPRSSSSRILTTDYDLTVTGDSVISYLPYFGRAYSAPLDPTKGGIQFTSTKFEYKQIKDGDEWEITIRPKDAADVQELYLTIFDNGRATLAVNNTNRQSISFNGYVKEGREKEKKAF